MIDHAWLQVSYMAQIIVACLLFMLAILYWPAFAVICLPAVALCLQAGLSEVLYCTICANATQHAANECYLALSIALGRTTPICPRSSTDC